MDLSQRLEKNGEHVVPRCVLTSSEAMLPLLNISNSSIRFKSNQVVAESKKVDVCLKVDICIVKDFCGRRPLFVKFLGY